MKNCREFSQRFDLAGGKYCIIPCISSIQNEDFLLRVLIEKPSKCSKSRHFKAEGHCKFNNEKCSVEFDEINVNYQNNILENGRCSKCQNKFDEGWLLLVNFKSSKDKVQ